MDSAVQLSYALQRPFLPTGGIDKLFMLLDCKGHGNMTSNRAPLNASLVLDRSGSMAGSPLQYSKQACQFVVSQFDSKDQLSVVAFDHEVETVCPPQFVLNKDLLKQRIDGVLARGTTNLSGGLLQGIRHVMQGKRDGSVNRVILLSDGHANEGITDAQRLAAVANEFRSAGIAVTTMGVGDGFDEELMESIAEQGGGNFYYIKQAEEIPNIFNKELQGLLQVVAQNVQLKLTPRDGVTVKAVYGYAARQNADGTEVSLGDIYHQEEKSILIELSVSPKPQGEHPLLTAAWSYAEVAETVAWHQADIEIRGHVTNNIDLLQLPSDPTVEKQVQITESAVILEQAIQAFDAGEFRQGQELLQQQAEKMLAYAVQIDDEEMRMESNVLSEQLANFSYDAQKRKELHAQKYRTMKRKKM